PRAYPLLSDITDLTGEVDKDNSDIWNAVYHNDVKPLSRLEKESKYSSMLLPSGELHQFPLSDFSLPNLEVELGEVDKNKGGSLDSPPTESQNKHGTLNEISVTEHRMSTSSITD